MFRRMIKQRCSILVILLVVITPVTSAYNHCLSMSMPAHLATSQVDSVSSLINEASPINHPNTAKKIHCRPPEKLFHNGGSCAFHTCVNCGINASTFTFTTFASNRSANIAFLPAYHMDMAISPEIRPPILIY